eukprot:XP_013997389.1 PREDICTED: uncharacterized protein LOC106570024 [Salmo salar]
MKYTEFTSSNQLRRQGKDIKQPAITEKDMAQLQNSQALNPGRPRGLVQKVWSTSSYIWVELKPNSFLVKTDENGLRYATLAYNEATKNHLDPRERGRESKRGFLFEQPGNPLCPVASLEKYLSKCPENALAFYLHPKNGECIGDSIWYTTYANHSIRAMAVQKRTNSGLEARELLASVTDRQKTLEQHPGRKTKNNAAPSTPKRLKQGSSSSSTDPDRYFNQCTIIQGNVQINVTYN